jgi:hypothetical protein
MQATVAGGGINTADGSFSFAAGRQARATFDGSFVWGDNTNVDIVASRANQFTARAQAGVRMITDTAGTTGCFLPAAGAAWNCTSARAANEHFQPVDGRTVLERLAELPIETWAFRGQDSGARHMGPMAEDFAAAFGVGDDDRSISTVDAHGVALAAIQGLNQLVAEQEAQLATQAERLAMVEQHNVALESRLVALARALGMTGALGER